MGLESGWYHIEYYQLNRNKKDDLKKSNGHQKVTIFFKSKFLKNDALKFFFFYKREFIFLKFLIIKAFFLKKSIKKSWF